MEVRITNGFAEVILQTRPIFSDLPRTTGKTSRPRVTSGASIVQRQVQLSVDTSSTAFSLYHLQDSTRP